MRLREVTLNLPCANRPTDAAGPQAPVGGLKGASVVPGDHYAFWGAVAAGAVFSSMKHVDGRRPPHTKERSELAIRARSDRLQRAELMADLVEYVAAEGITSADGVAKAAKEVLSTLPDARVDESKVIAAAVRFNAD
jgi:hypothetical protein